MLQMFNRLLQRYGTGLRVEDTEVTGFFYSVNSRSWQNMEQAVGPLGEIPRGQYICILPAATAAKAGDTIVVGEKSYRIRRVEDMRSGEQVVYRWSLCVERGGEDLW